MVCEQLAHLSSPEFLHGRPPAHSNKNLQLLVRPHIDSFNYALEEGLKVAVQDIPPRYIQLTDGTHAELSILDAKIGSPTIDASNIHAKTIQLFPSECRECHTTYRAKLQVTVQWKKENIAQSSITRSIADVPIMVKSANCSLADLTPAQLVERHEEAEECGGYFIVNGNEKIIRMLIMPRRNYPLAMERMSWRGRGPLFTEYGVQVRCVAKDQSGVTNVLHYLSDGSCTLAFVYRKEQFFVPLAVMLRALCNSSDHRIYTKLIAGLEDDVFFKDAVANMLRTLLTDKLDKQDDVLKYIGSRFQVKLNLPPWFSDEDVAKFLINKCVLTHLPNNMHKFNLLVFMTQKLFALANHKCAKETPDNPMNQEVLQGGHVYLIMLKDKLDSWLASLKAALERSMKAKPASFLLNQSTIMSAMKAGASNVGQAMDYFLATGNVVSNNGLGFMQSSGFTVVADKLNALRYFSHFRCIHRGAFFTQMRTTSVRRLLPEAWGFICPVHTPDGAPCGLLNHLAANVQIVNSSQSVSHLPKLLASLGMLPIDGASLDPTTTSGYSVLLDGKVIGRVPAQLADGIAQKLRLLKASAAERVPSQLEICLVPRTNVPSQYPGLFLFSELARMVRPTTNLSTNSQEMIGTFEQTYMDIALRSDEIKEGVTTHLELGVDSMLSALAKLTPFSDFNPSPRNIYQLQMGKQTMGIPCQALKHRSDNKMYKLQTAQSPVVRTKSYDDYGFDNFPLGTNAVVAVISYTGYDMEDAMVINKASLERGFGHGSIYKAEVVNLALVSDEKFRCTLTFGLDPEATEELKGFLDKDGLPPIGRYVQKGEPFYSYYNFANASYTVVKYKSMEPSYIDDVKVLGHESGEVEMRKVCIKQRIQRNPIIGDKFASRHGQKGILSQKWPAQDMPFSESGMVPDILFNPHGFPSRMTIGMIIESMAGKSASLHGITHDASPFQFSEEEPASDYFGDMLKEAGYNYYGNERLYSGVNGREMEVSIFMGVVYYQRLRHMVADKFQVRTTGPVDNLTHQPVQGRKRQGGIRFGEMERDALISHGSSFLLQDRLFHCSDKTQSSVCTKCGSLVTPVSRRQAEGSVLDTMTGRSREWVCKVCGDGRHITQINVPYVFKYLTAELAAMNIKVGLDVS